MRGADSLKCLKAKLFKPQFPGPGRGVADPGGGGVAGVAPLPVGC